MLENLVWFIVGMVISSLFRYVLNLGHSVNVLKQTQRSCAALFLVSEQGLQEILQLKYLAMEEAKRSQQNVTAQKYIDQMNIVSIKKSIMRNYVGVFPKSYEHIMEYTNWEEMENYINRETKEQEQS